LGCRCLREDAISLVQSFCSHFLHCYAFLVAKRRALERHIGSSVGDTATASRGPRVLRQLVDAHQFRAGADDDRSGLGSLLRGLVRKKNVLSTMMQSFAMMAIITVLWALVVTVCRLAAAEVYRPFAAHLSTRRGAQPDADYAATIPQQTS